MNLNKKIRALYAIMLLLFFFPVRSSSEFQITTNQHDQECPAIHGDIVVWQDGRNGNYDIYGYDLATKREFQVTTDINSQQNPAIFGDIIVWDDDRNGNRDIYGYDLSTQEEFRITRSSGDQTNPAIHGDILSGQMVEMESGMISKISMDTIFPHRKNSR